MRTFIALIFLYASVFAQEENLRPGLVKTWFRDSSTVLVPVPAGKRLGGNFVGTFGGTITSPYTTAIKFWNTSNVYWGDTVKTAYGIPSGTSGQWGWLTRNAVSPQSGTLLPATNTDTSFVNYLKSTGYISFTSAIGSAADAWIRRVNPGRVVLGTTATDSAGVLSLGRIHGYGKSTFDSLQLNGSMYFGTDNSYDIGRPTGARPRTVYALTSVRTARVDGNTTGSGDLTLGGDGNVVITTGAALIASGSRITGTGKLGVLNTAPLTAADITGTLRSTDTLRVGDWTAGSWIKPGDAAWTVVSDVNKKENIRDYAGLDLSKFSQVKPKIFRFKENSFYRDFDESSLSDTLTVAEKAGKRATFLTDNRAEAARLNAIDHLGFIAQDFNKLFPGRSKLTIDYAELLGVMWLKTAELEARIKAAGL